MALLNGAKAASYSVVFSVKSSVPAVPLTPGSITPPDPPGSENPGPLLPAPLEWADVAATMTWYVKHPRRRFDATVQEGAEYVDPARVHPGMVPNRRGVLPSFYFLDGEAVICAEVDAGSRCESVGRDWAQWAMPVIGQSPLLYFAFLAEADETQLGRIWRGQWESGSRGAREMQGAAAHCFGTEAFGPPIEWCYSSMGVPLRIEVSPDPSTGWRGLTMEALSHRIGIPESELDPPSAPQPSSLALPGPGAPTPPP